MPRLSTEAKRILAEWKIYKNFIVGADWSQLENRIIALLSGDPKLLEWYKDDVDVHCKTATFLFDLSDDTPDEYWKPGAECSCGLIEYKGDPKEPCKSCGKERFGWYVGSQQRQIAKGARYAFHYGASENTMLEQLRRDRPDLKRSDVIRLRGKLGELHKTLLQWQTETYKTARIKDAIVEVLSGKELPLYGEMNLTQIRNIPIQGAGAFLANGSMETIVTYLGINPLIGTNEYEESVVAQMHDAIYLQGPDPIRLFDALKKGMEIEVTLNGNSMLFPIDVGMGWTWNVEKVPTREKAQAYFQELLLEGEKRGFCARV